MTKDLKTVHEINYSTTQSQKATIFGKTETVDLEFIDTRNSFPRDSLLPTDKTPRKYFLHSNKEIYIVIIPDLKTSAVTSNGISYTKQLFGDNYNAISNSIKNNNSVSNSIFKKVTKYNFFIGVNGIMTQLILQSMKTNNLKI
ncbi:MAG: hypothetical protein M3015_12505 [Bacteroidota bacterium]|nr:hypothetical protein [Bacteroidota bacterium]